MRVEMRLTNYQFTGLTLMLLGLLLAGVTYILLSLNPLTAFWLGVAVVGASMLLTPSSPLERRSVSRLLKPMLDNLERFVEQFRLWGCTVYRVIGDRVYAIASSCRCTLEGNPSRLVEARGDCLVATLESLIQPNLIEGFEDVCSAIDHIAVEVLGVAEGIECIEAGDSVTVEFKSWHVTAPSGLTRAVGSIYAAITASVYAMLRAPCRIVEDKRLDGAWRVTVRAVKPIG